MRDPAVSDKRVRQAIGFATNRDAIVKYLRRDLAHPATGILPPQAWAYEPDIFTFTYDPGRRRNSCWTRPGIAIPTAMARCPACACRLKVSTNEEVRLQSTVIQQDLRRVGIDLDVRSYEFATVFADILKGNFQIMSLQWVGGRGDRPGHPAACVSFDAGAASRIQPGLLQEPAKWIGSSTWPAPPWSEQERKAFYGAAQRIIAEDAVYIPIWNRVNVAVAAEEPERPPLLPIIDFSMLRLMRRN